MNVCQSESSLRHNPSLFLQNRTRKRDKRLTTQNSCKILDGYSRRHHFSNDSRYKTSPALRVKRTSKWSVAAERVHLLSTVSAFHFVKGTGNLKGTGIEVDNVRKSLCAASFWVSSTPSAFDFLQTIMDKHLKRKVETFPHFFILMKFAFNRSKRGFSGKAVIV